MTFDGTLWDEITGLNSRVFPRGKLVAANVLSEALEWQLWVGEAPVRAPT